jgi:hypothetical protein
MNYGNRLFYVRSRIGADVANIRPQRSKRVLALETRSEAKLTFGAAKIGP